MINIYPKPICKQAQAYYYAYLHSQPQEHISTEIFAHIDKCHFCRAGVNRLKIILAESEKHTVESTGQTNSTITTNLRLHFAYTGVSVTCGTVRPFLPSLADPTLEIGVPTPITVHLEKCQQCANDLETIRQLNLTHKQLHRLGQLFAEEFAVDAQTCAKAQNAIDSAGAIDFKGISTETLQHLSLCPDCRKRLYNERKTISKNLPQNIKQSPIPCDAICAADIFDYVVPYGINPDRDRYAMFRKSLTSHLINCPICLDKMQKLHDAVYSILERQESGIVTCFKLGNSARDSIVSNPDEAYEGQPIEVQVFDKSNESDTIESGSPGPKLVEAPTEGLKPKQRLSIISIRPFIKPAAVAAVLILTGILLFINSPVTKAAYLGHIYEALKQIKNVYLTTFVPEKATPAQQIWISQELNIKMFKTEKQCVLWDIKGKSKKSKDVNTGAIKIEELNNDALAKVGETMNVPWGLLPFSNISAVPKGAKWQKVTDENIDTNIANTKVYDLVWTDKGLNGSIIHRRWRGYIGIKTKLPKRIEWWEKLAEDEEYELTTVINVDYPSTSEIQDAIEDAGF